MQSALTAVMVRLEQAESTTNAEPVNDFEIGRGRNLL